MSDIAVLLADDEPSIRSSLRLLVDSEAGMEVVGEAEDGRGAIELAGELHPDVVLMDVRMPSMDGIAATRALTARGGAMRVIVLTTFDLDEYVYGALASGASGFVLKNSPPAEVLRAIRVVHEGNALLAPEVTKRLIGRFAGRHEHELLAHLTARERETLVLIGRGRSNAEIAAALFVTATTARTYVSRVMAKLQARDRAGLVVIAYESGLVTPSAH
ncbi:response regulator transcription factor [Arenivirga flava]|uniref:DNA-binding response regulator n=1 Tax=Arenivirga flava TaxID=1930060 RepID=A0AA37UCF7_9MICO|nr:response regulator transcription factor [Arenivirga flava]GMA27640.1 DNA-binding response regulator [Arenivirga flava]